MCKKVIKLATDTDQEEVARMLQKIDLLAFPIVDMENCLVGIITPIKDITGLLVYFYLVNVFLGHLL